MHSRLYSGRSFATFPGMVFLLTFGFGLVIARFSTLEPSTVLETLPGFALFLGLAVGSVGFSSRGASRGVLGDYTLTIHSSKTLPVDGKRLLAEFVVKDLLYYTAFFLSPVALGFSITSGFSIAVLWMPVTFLLGIGFSFALARSSLELPNWFRPSYAVIGEPLVEKTELDLERSAGGLLKLLFSYGVLAGFYWFLVLNFPLASYFLENPLLSFSVLIGTITISSYNWLNRFDSLEEYTHMPVTSRELLDAKQKAFTRLNLPIIALMAFAPFVVYGGDVLLALVVSFSISTYTMGAASLVLGLEPNTRIYSTWHFSRLILAVAGATIPLLLATIAGFPWYILLLLSGFTAVSGLAMSHWALEKARF